MEGKGAEDLKKPKVGLYLRLSREDEGTRESMSIENQRTFLLRWAEERGWPVQEIYSDDGYTGTNFDRPAFRRMLRDIEAGRIDTVVTKDLSRLGRDQIGTMHYYQRYFPAHGVRYLAAAEGFDTAGGSGAGIALPFLAAANDFYTADISRKVRAALDARRRSGLFIGAAPPLGYRKDPGRKGALLPEEETAWVVRRVFETYLRAGSVVGTAKVLSGEGVPTPAQCRGGSPGRWSDTMVRRILTNPTYAGHLTQNRTEKVSYKAPRRTALPREMWTVVPHTHPPLVSQVLFDRVQAMLAARELYPPAGKSTSADRAGGMRGLRRSNGLCAGGKLRPNGVPDLPAGGTVLYPPPGGGGGGHRGGGRSPAASGTGTAAGGVFRQVGERGEGARPDPGAGGVPPGEGLPLPGPGIRTSDRRGVSGAF